MFPSVGDTPFIFAFSIAPKQTDAGDDNEDPNDFRLNRPVIGEGDQVVASSPGGGFLILRRGGTLEMGASEFAKRVFIPIRNTVRDYFENWFGHGAGGSFGWETRREDDQHGVKRTPVELKLDVKEFAEDSPIIKVRLGRIAEEDAEQIPQGQVASIIASLNINDRVKYWVDRQGGVASVVYGPTTASYQGPRVEHFSGQVSRRIRGRLIEFYGSQNKTIADDYKVALGGDHVVEAKGSIRRTSTGAYRRTVGTDEVIDIGGRAARTISGSAAEQVGGDFQSSVGGSSSRSVGGDTNDTTTGAWTMLVANKGIADVGASLKVLNGQLLLQSVVGDIVIGVGPTPDSLVSKITMKIDGTYKLEGPLGTTTVEVNATGVQISTPGGSFAIDAAGNVRLGPTGPGGAVVTTLTHPVDFMTGIPIMGSSQVGAAGAPSLVAIPPTFAPTG
jgi:hypothetical protein